ncbi:MAG: PAS domain S-box protein [bacterium]
MKKDNIMDTGNLRRLAEEIRSKKAPKIISHLSESDTLKLIHELEVHQVELEMQNEELTIAKSSAQDALNLFDFAPSGFFVLSEEGEIIKLNLSGANMLGKERSLLINSRFGFFVSNDTKTIFNHFLEKVFTGKSKESCELTLSLSNNLPIYVQLTGIVAEENGQCLVTTVDITERRRAEDALRISEAQKDAILNGIKANIAFVDNGLKIIWANKSAAKSVNKSPDEMVGRTCYELWADPSKPCQDCPSVRALLTKESADILIRTPDGRVWEEKGEPIFDSEGNIIGIVEIANDITDRKRTENLLEQTRNNYETFFNTIDEFLFVLDEQGNIIHTNSTVIDHLGYTPDELAGLSVLMLHPPERRDEAGQIVGEMLAGRSEFCPIPLITKAGIQIPVETRVSNGIWDGKPVIFGVTKDISKLKLSEEKFSKLFHINPSACGLSDLITGKYIEVNKEFYTLFGFDKEEVIGKTAIEFGILTPESMTSILLNADSQGNVTNVEADLKAKNGDIKHVLLSSENIYVQEEKLRYTVVQDITERKKAEEMLYESEEKHRRLIENSHDIIYTLNADGVFVFVSPAWTVLVGHPVSEVIGRPFHLFVHPDDLPGCFEFMQKLLESGQRQEGVEYRVKHSNGSWYWHTSSAVPLRDESGMVFGLEGIARDISERKKAEEELIKISKKFEAIVSASPDGIGMVSLDGKVQLMSDKLASIYGYSIEEKDEMIGKSLFGFIDPSNHKLLVDNIHKLIDGNKGKEISEYLAVKKDNSRFYVDVNSTILYDSEGNPSSILFVERDISERKKTEQDIKLKSEELIKINAEKDKFFSIIAHDMRGPFNGFLGFTQIMAEELPNMTMTEIQKMADLMRKSATNLYRLLGNLLEWSLMQQGLIPFNPEVVKLLPIIDDSTATIIEPAKSKGIGINYDIPLDVVVFADRNMIQTIIRNLVSNAVKFTPKGGQITISAKYSDDQSVEISIKDTGIGMSPKILNNLFLSDVNTNRKGTEGELSTGLGLMLCKEFIEKHGGKLCVESEVGKGSNFYFILKTKKTEFL